MKYFFERVREICYYALYFFAFTISILIGLFFLALALSTSLQDYFIQNFLRSSIFLSFIGLFFLFLAGFLLLKAFYSTKKSIYTYQLNHVTVGVHKNVINRSIDSYLKSLFKKENIESEVIFKKRKVFISVSLPCTAISDQPILLAKIQKEIDTILKNTLGESYSCNLRVIFEKEL